MVTAMANNVPSRLIGELTFQEIPQRLRAASILCLPIGSIEQHGPHLPLNTDVVLAEEFTRRIVGRWVETYDLWQLPTLTVSLAREHEWAPGTLVAVDSGNDSSGARPRPRDRARPADSQSRHHQRSWRQSRNPGSAGAGFARRLRPECLRPAPRRLGGRRQRRRHTGNPWREKRNVDDAGDCAAAGSPRSDPAKNQAGCRRRAHGSSSTRRSPGPGRRTKNRSPIPARSATQRPRPRNLDERLLEQVANNAGNVFKQLLDRQHRDRD